MWNNSHFDFVGKKSNGNSGGIASIWDTSCFSLTTSVEGDGFLVVVGLIDLPMGAKRFTRMSGNKLSKLDRILVSHHVIELWPNSHTIILPREFSDHNPLLLSNSGPKFGPIPFKLYNSWLLHKDFTKIVQDCWMTSPLIPAVNMSVHPSISFKSKLQHLKANIKIWRQKLLEAEASTSTTLRQKIDSLDSKAEISPLSEAEINTRTTLVKSLADLEHRNIMDLRQKAKTRWALEGDENSRFFHDMINNRRNRSRINGLNIHGDWVLDPVIIKNHVYDYFGARFKETNRSRPLFKSNLFK
ncbi:cytochrome P450 [Tanacetum coccineum]